MRRFKICREDESHTKPKMDKSWEWDMKDKANENYCRG